MKKKKAKLQMATQNRYKNLLRTMRLFLLCMILGINCIFANESYTQTTHLNLNVENAKLEDVFEEIRKQSEFTFFYNNDQVDVKKKVTINVNRATITDILDKILEKEYTYTIEDKYILIKKKSRDNDYVLPKKPRETVQSEKKISGTITDKDGLPLIGVSIQIIGGSAATMSDIDGHYTINVPDEKAKLRFSYLGHRPFETVVGNRTTINVLLEEVPHNMEEIIVVGYGTQKKVNLTGAVNQISAQDLEDRPVQRLSQALQGTIPNLQVTFAGGVPGQDASINVRGTTSIHGGQPYVLIDGIPGNINRVNAQEVESITVLKDAAASAIYGAKGPWGVVLVTTKQAKAGKTSISYNGNFGWSTPTVSTDFITTGYDWMRLNDASIAHVGGYSRYPESDMNELYIRRNDKTEHPDRPWVTIQNRDGRDRYVYYGNYDWWDVMFHEWQPSMTHSINFTGGNDKINYLLNGSYNSKDGMMKINRDKYESYTMRSKISAQATPWMKITNNTNFYHQSYNYTGRKGGGNANFSSINVHASPAYAPTNPDGSATYFSGFNNYTIGDGLYAILVDGNTKGQDTKYEFRTTTELNFNIAKGLTATANYTYNLYTNPSYYRQYPATYSLYPGVKEIAPKANVNQLTESQSFNHMHVINLFATYEKSFNTIHNFKAMAGFNQQLDKSKTRSAIGENILSPTLNDLSLAATPYQVGGGQSELALRGAFYRINYDYKGKYLFETNGRYDGTSRFPKGDRFGFFPSASAGWRISEEGFFEPLTSVVDNLKLRASYGSLGNQDIDQPYPYINRMNAGTMAYIFDGERAKYVNQPNPISRSLTWETIQTTNFGVDVNLFNSRLELNFDVYERMTKDMLYQAAAIPSVYGATQPLVNSADMKTKGFELTVSWKDGFNIAGRRFNYNISGLLSDNTSRITKMNNDTKFTYDYYEGKEFGEIWGFITNGYFKTEPEALTYPVDQSYLNVVRNDNHIGLSAGDIRFEDLDGDGKITSGTNTVDNPGDQRVIGNSTPRYSFGFNLGADYAGFDLSMFFQGIGRCHWYPGNEADRFWGPFGRPYYSFIPKDFESKLWTPENPDSYFPRLLTYIALNARNELRATNNRYLQDLAYVRLKNLTIGYTIPQSLTQKLKISKCRLYLSGENLLTFTKLDTDYIDPEQAMANANGRVYPFSKIYSFGVNITF